MLPKSKVGSGRTNKNNNNNNDTNKIFPIKSQHLYSPHDPKWICIFRFMQKRKNKMNCLTLLVRLHFIKLNCMRCFTFYFSSNSLSLSRSLANLFMRMHTTAIISYVVRLSKTRAPALSHR